MGARGLGLDMGCPSPSESLSFPKIWPARFWAKFLSASERSRDIHALLLPKRSCAVLCPSLHYPPESTLMSLNIGR